MNLKSGIFDEPCISVISLGTVHSVARESGRGVGLCDLRRFRPNVVIETDSPEPFAEDKWVGRTLMFGKGDKGAAPIAAIGVTMRDERYFEMPNWYLKRGIGTAVQVANTWTKITARYLYAIVRNGKEPENPQNLLVAATLEKAITDVFAGSPIRNAEARSSTLLCSTNNTVNFKSLQAQTESS